MFDPARLVFLDETATSTNMVRLRGRCPRGQRLVDHVPHGHWKTITFVAGLRRRAMVAPLVLDGPMNAQAFVTYLKECLVPKLKRGDVVMMDNLPVHRVAAVREVIEAAGASYDIFPNIPRTSTRLNKPSASSRHIYEKLPNQPFRASPAG
jgi:hypothetical protein